MLDLITVYIVIVVLMPLLYFLSHDFNSYLSLTLLILLSIPTTMALVNGAPYVPTPMERVRKIVALAKLKKGQKVYDIGCGDGRFVYVAANEYGADATGIELSPIVYLLAKVRKILWKSQAKIRFGNFKFWDLSDADVVFCYLLPEALAKIQPELDKQFKKGTRIYSYSFEIPNWKLIEKIEREKESSLGPILVYEKS